MIWESNGLEVVSDEESTFAWHHLHGRQNNFLLETDRERNLVYVRNVFGAHVLGSFRSARNVQELARLVS